MKKRLRGGCFAKLHLTLETKLVTCLELAASDCLHESHQIIQSTDLFKNDDSFRN